MRASRPIDRAAQSKAHCSVAATSPRPQRDFFDSKKKGAETRLHSIPSHAHGKSDRQIFDFRVFIKD